MPPSKPGIPIKRVWKVLKEDSKLAISNYGEIKLVGSGDTVTPYDNGKGYLKIHAGGKQYYVHRLVATYFRVNHKNKPCVNHINGNKSDNRSTNLEWVTHSQNADHSHRTGLTTKFKYKRTYGRFRTDTKKDSESVL